MSRSWESDRSVSVVSVIPCHLTRSSPWSLDRYSSLTVVVQCLDCSGAAASRGFDVSSLYSGVGFFLSKAYRLGYVRYFTVKVSLTV